MLSITINSLQETSFGCSVSKVKRLDLSFGELISVSVRTRLLSDENIAKETKVKRPLKVLHGVVEQIY